METKVAAKAATCTEDGNLEYYHCTHCDKYFADEAGANKLDSIEYTSEKLGHNFVGGVCTRCDAKELTNIDVTIAIEEGAIGGNSDGTTIKDTLIAHPGTCCNAHCICAESRFAGGC